MSTTTAIIIAIIVIIIVIILVYLISGPGEREGTIINKDGRVYLVKGMDSTSVTDGMTIKSKRSADGCFSELVEFRIAIENESDDPIDQATIEVSIDQPPNSILPLPGDTMNIGVVQKYSGNEMTVQFNAGDLEAGPHTLKIRGTGTHKALTYTDQATLTFCKN